MTAAGPAILALNGGSSSVKFALYDPSPLRRRLRGSVDRVGIDGTLLSVEDEVGGTRFGRALPAGDHAAAATALVDHLESAIGAGVIEAVGHRIVHGLEQTEPAAITPQLLDRLRVSAAIDPDHAPIAIALIEAVARREPGLRQVACFDTAFHAGLPRVARVLPIPRRYEAKGIRRYGFHGLSYSYLMEELAHVAGEPAARGRVILAHLGSGASMAAVCDGRSVDTTMGFTPAGGLMMGTRSGDLDPGIAACLERSEGRGASEFFAMASRESGLLGVSETSADMRALLACEDGDSRAAEAVALFCYQARKCVGAYAAVLGGVETLVFSGGIGENAAPVRARICAGLGFLGIDIGAERNAAHAGVISSGASRVTVRVIRTDEELMIARSVSRLLHLDD